MYEKEAAILNSIHDLFEVSAYAVDSKGAIELKQCAHLGFDAVGSDESLRHKLMGACSVPNDACVYYDEAQFYYLSYRTDNLFFIFGPAYADEPSKGEKAAYIKKHPTGKRNISIPVIEEQKLRSAVNLLRI